MTTTYTVYKTRNSPFLQKILDIDGTVYSATEMAAITRVLIKYTPTVAGVEGTPQEVDSDVNDDVFDWTTFASAGQLKIDLGLMGLTVGRDLKAELVVYDSTYTSGRMVAQMDIEVSNEVEDDEVTPVTALSKLPLTKTDDYTLDIADFYRRSVRLNALVEKTFTLPSMSEDYDGWVLDVIIENIGDLVLACQDDTTILNSSHTQLTGTTRYGSIQLEYDYALDMFIVRKSYGSWSGS